MNSLIGQLTDEQTDEMNSGTLKPWVPDHDGFDAMVADLDEALALLKPAVSSTPMTLWQAVVAETYDDGAFKHLIDDTDWRGSLESCGDGLFRFVMIELSASEACDSFDHACLRLNRVLQDVIGCVAALGRIATMEVAHA